jgi:hypothetical protein
MPSNQTQGGEPTAPTPSGPQQNIPPSLGSPEPVAMSTSCDVPPSYEDAMAYEIGPVDGPRRYYNLTEGSSASTGDVKLSPSYDGEGERLFPNSGPGDAPPNPSPQTQGDSPSGIAGPSSQTASPAGHTIARKPTPGRATETSH